MWAVKVCKAIDCLCYERAIHCWFKYKYKPYQRSQKFFVRRRPLNILSWVFPWYAGLTADSPAQFLLVELRGVGRTNYVSGCEPGVKIC